MVKIPTADCLLESLVCGVQASGAGSSDCIGPWFPCHFCLLEEPRRSSSSCWDTGPVTRRLERRLEKTGTVLVFIDRIRTYFVFPQAGHGSKSPSLEGKKMFSQGVWGPCDHLQHQRLIVQGVSIWRFVLVVSSAKWAAEVQPIPFLSLASVSSYFPGEHVVWAPVSCENHSYVFRASVEYAPLQGLLLTLWKATRGLVYFVREGCLQRECQQLFYLKHTLPLDFSSSWIVPTPVACILSWGNTDLWYSYLQGDTCLLHPLGKT